MTLPLSFQNVAQLWGRAELLPKGTSWNGKWWETKHPTAKPLSIFWRNPVKCLQDLLHRPLVADHLDLHPFQLFKSAERLMRVYTGWLSGDIAWQMQVHINHSPTDQRLTSTSPNPISQMVLLSWVLFFHPTRPRFLPWLAIVLPTLSSSHSPTYTWTSRTNHPIVHSCY